MPGWESLPVTVAAQTVQRSAFPQAYAKWEGLAAQLAGQLAGVAQPDGGLRPRGAREGRRCGRHRFRVARDRQAVCLGGHRAQLLRLLGSHAQGVRRRGHHAAPGVVAAVPGRGHLPVHQAQAGDLLFYATDPTDPSTIHHVMLYLGNGEMIEAPYTGQPVRVRPVAWDYRELVPLATRPGTTPNTRA